MEHSPEVTGAPPPTAPPSTSNPNEILDDRMTFLENVSIV